MESIYSRCGFGTRVGGEEMRVSNTKKGRLDARLDAETRVRGTLAKTTVTTDHPPGQIGKAGNGLERARF